MNELLNINNNDHDYIWLESDGRYSRYQVDIDECGDGISEWFCDDCGNPVDDIDEGCEYCDDCCDDEGDDMD